MPSNKKRIIRPFPASSFEEPLEFAKKILEFGSGQPVRRISIFDELGKSPESGASRQLVTNTSKYGLITGSYKAEYLTLTDDGAKAANEDISPKERARAQVKLAILGIKEFKKLFDTVVENKLPAKAALVDAAKSKNLTEALEEELVDTFIVNLRFVGLLKTLSGAERIITLDHLLDTIPGSSLSKNIANADLPTNVNYTTMQAKAPHYDQSCFYITPIGSDDSDERLHSDLFLGSIVEPALESFDLTVIRADAIDKPGIIGKQIIDYIVMSKLVIVDLSFHNPNVFYELAIRHMMRKPVVQIMRKADKIPFDVNQIRTVIIDTTSIYSLVPKIETYKSEIANQVRRAMENPEFSENPIASYYPSLSTTIE